ncbi:MAG TPA: tetratricopeptide repeat protein [Anaerolineales bacterium]|nr:tetratricopeptide repeat protein [Anaerolineales bacterium]HUS83522.1 tetratricopeptide repeat protein [Anaerolineales bacterium]
MDPSAYILDVDEATFESEVILRSHELPVVVDFWAPWCGPCRILGPLLERLAIEAGGSFLLAKVNVDENPGLSVRYGVQGIPAVKAFKNGQVETEFVGAQPESVVRKVIGKLAPSEAEAAVENARSLLATHHWEKAETSFREIYAMDETNAPAALGLLESLLMQGKGEEALHIIDVFPPGNEWAKAEQHKPLAALLAEVEENGLGNQDDPLAAELYQAARLIGLGNLPAAMDGMLDILREQKDFRAGLPKKVLLALFAIIGDQDTLTQQYRDELASVLF